MNKILLSLFFSSIIVLSTALATGCAGQATGTPTTNTPPAAATTPSAATMESNAPTQPELQQALAGSLAAMKTLSTYRFVLNMAIKMEVTGGSGAGNIDFNTLTGGDVDQSAREMLMVINTTLKQQSPSATPVSQNASVSMYMMQDELYMSLELPPFGKQWMKIPISDEVKNAYNLNTVSEQLAPLELGKNLTFLRYEVFDGSSCYVLALTPDTQQILPWVEKDLPAGLNEADPDAISKMFKSLSYTLWIAKDTSFIKNMDATIRLQVTPGQFTQDAQVDFSNLTMDIGLNLKLFDHNKPISVTLPPEAQDAIEIPSPGQTQTGI